MGLAVEEPVAVEVSVEGWTESKKVLAEEKAVVEMAKRPERSTLNAGLHMLVACTPDLASCPRGSSPAGLLGRIASCWLEDELGRAEAMPVPWKFSAAEPWLVLVVPVLGASVGSKHSNPAASNRFVLRIVVLCSYTRHNCIPFAVRLCHLELWTRSASRFVSVHFWEFLRISLPDLRV